MSWLVCVICLLFCFTQPVKTETAPHVTISVKGATGYEELLRGDWGLYEYDAVRDETVTLFLQFYDLQKRLFDISIQGGEGHDIDDQNDIQCSRTEVTCNLTYSTLVDRTTASSHQAVALDRSGSYIVQTFFDIYVKNVQKLSWDNSYKAERWRNGSLLIVAGTEGYPRPTEYTLLDNSGNVLFTKKAFKISEEITLNTHGNMSLVARNRYNDTITKTISIPPAVSKTAEITVKDSNPLNSIVIAVAGAVGVFAFIVLVVVCLKLKRRKTGPLSSGTQGTSGGDVEEVKEDSQSLLQSSDDQTTPNASHTAPVATPPVATPPVATPPVATPTTDTISPKSPIRIGINTCKPKQRYMSTISSQPPSDSIDNKYKPPLPAEDETGEDSILQSGDLNVDCVPSGGHAMAEAKSMSSMSDVSVAAVSISSQSDSEWSGGQGSSPASNRYLEYPSNNIAPPEDDVKDYIV